MKSISKRLLVLSGAIVLLGSLAACDNPSGDGNQSGDGVTPQSVIDEANATVEGAYGTGADGAPPTEGPVAQSGKDVWYISCGQQFASCAEQATAFQAASDVLGWNMTLGDAKGSPVESVSLINQAIAAQADGIAINAFDCDKGRAALEAARDAGIPVVNWNGVDCGVQNTPDALFTAGVQINGSMDPRDYFNTWGDLMASYVIAKMNGEGKVLAFQETTYGTLIATSEAFNARMKTAPGIEVVTIEFTISQIPNETTALFESALLANPDADAVWTEVDSVIGLGLQSAVASGPNPDIILFGAEGTAANFEFIRQGVQQNSVVRQDPQATWGQADTLNRIFAGVDPAELPDQGGGFQIVDKEHNLPAEGETYDGALDYVSAYTAIWKG